MLHQRHESIAQFAQGAEVKVILTVRVLSRKLGPVANDTDTRRNKQT